MSQIVNKFLAQAPADTLKGNNTGSTANVADLTVAQVQAMLAIPTNSSPLSIASGGTGQSTQQAALNALAGAVTIGEYLRGDGTNVTMSALQAGDVPTLNQNTTGTAANITATSNSTLTTLSALTTAGSLAISGSQVSGGTFGAINGSALTNLAAANLSGILPVGVTGGSGLSIATSQLTGQTTLAQLPNIANDTILGNNSGSSAVPSALSVAQVNAILPVFTSTLNGLAPSSGGGSSNFLRADGTWAAPAGSTSGTVTSVAFSDASTAPIYSISGSPVTSSGTLEITLETQAANLVFAGPVSGSAAQPSFRSLVAADIPSLSATYVTQSEVGAVNGVASLDASGKVPYSQLPSALMTYKGAFDPLTQSLSTLDATPMNGDVYRASVDGVVVSGPLAGTQFYAGDFAIYNGTAWERAPLADGVVSVNGESGAIVSTVASANGFAGTYSANILTISTSVTGLLKGNGTSVSAASAGTDYVIPSGSITGTAANITATSNSTLTTLSALSLPTSQLSGSIALASQVSGTLPILNGGTGQTTAAAAFNALNPMTTTGDMIYESATNVASRLAVGSTGQVLTVVGGVPAWSNTAATMTPGKDTVVLSSTDITNQYITLSHTPLANSTDLLIVGAGDQLEGASYDYTVSGATIVFKNGLATGGVSALVAGDILQVAYMY